VSAAGLYVTPGLIDIHTHAYVGGRPAAVFPDDAVLPTGTPTIADAGVSGWRTFDDFKMRIIDKSRTRVLAFLNIVGRGMGGPKVENNVADMDPAATAAKVKQHRDIIVGIKTAHFGLSGWDAVKRAVEAGRLSDTPVMVDSHILSGSGRNTREKLLDILRPGDIHICTTTARWSCSTVSAAKFRTRRSRRAGEESDSIWVTAAAVSSGRSPRARCGRASCPTASALTCIRRACFCRQ
jgi:predicted amidohydrolase